MWGIGYGGGRSTLTWTVFTRTFQIARVHGVFDYRCNIYNTSLTPPSDQVCGYGQGRQAIAEYMHR